MTEQIQEKRIALDEQESTWTIEATDRSRRN